jgi:hypothetical protein
VPDRVRTEPAALRRVRTIMMGTDVGFLLYWVATAFGVISVGGGQVMEDWNWSFLGLDLLAIGTGLLSGALARHQPETSRMAMVVSLSLTMAAGLMAVSFWALRCEFDPAWWAPNLWLLLFPVAALLLVRPGRERP